MDLTAFATSEAMLVDIVANSVADEETSPRCGGLCLIFNFKIMQ